MDVASYFPANISAVPNDENEETVTATAVEGDQKSTPIVGKRVMSGRKRRDPPLSTILEIPSTTTLFPADTSVVCLLCYRKISGSIPNFVKPCQCPLVFVHTTCAIDHNSFFGTTCSQCHQKYRPDMTESKKNQSPSKLPNSTVNAMVPSQRCDNGLCVLCHNQKYQKPDWPQKSDARLIRPCFCGFVTHHGCMLEVLRTEKACALCGVTYRYVEYGTIADFCRRYSVQHVCYTLLFVFLAVFFFLAFRGSFVFRSAFEFAPIALSIIAVFLLCVLLGSCVFLIKHTLVTRLPRFRRRYGQVTVVPYDPDVRTKKEAMRSLKMARDLHISVNDIDIIPLNPVEMEQNEEEDDGNHVESSVEAARTDQSDLSLGQHMFGVSTNPHKIFSSTPLNHKTKCSVFVNDESSETV